MWTFSSKAGSSGFASMKPAFYFVLLLLGTIAEIGCSRDGERAVYHSNMLLTHELLPADTLTFNNSDSMFITRTGHIASWREHILVSDFYQKSVWVFDMSLRPIRTLGRKGRGPGEFVNFPTIVPGDNSLWLLDWGLMRATQYDTSLTLCAMKALPAGYSFRWQGLYFQNKLILAMRPARTLQDIEQLRDEHPFTVLDTNFHVLSHHWEWDEAYFREGLADRTYARHNADVLLAPGWNGGFFGLQKATFLVTHFSSELDRTRKFG